MVPLPLQNRFQVLANSLHNDYGLTSLGALMNNAGTAQTGVAPRNGKTQVQSLPRKSPNHKAIYKMSQEKARDTCNDTSSLMATSTHQQNDISQEQSNNASTLHSRQVVQDLVTVPNIPVDCNISDLNAFGQLQDTVVDNFSWEQTVPLYI